MPAVSLKVYPRTNVQLPVNERAERGKGPVGRLRREQSLLPGVLYGLAGDPVAFKVEARTLERALSHGGQDAIFLVEFDGQEPQQAVVREIQYHKVKGQIEHVDMLRVDPKQNLRIAVPLITLGVPVGVRISGGALQQTVTELEMDCLASEMPARVEIDISELELGDSVHVSDLLEQESRIATDPNVTIANVLMPRLAASEEEEEGEDEGEGEGEGEGEAQEEGQDGGN